MKTYLKDLMPHEVIRRLKAGEVIKCEKTKISYKVIDGVICGLWNDGGIDYNARIICDKYNLWYFETPDKPKVEKGKCYRTRDGRKAFVAIVNEVVDKAYGVVEGDKTTRAWTLNGSYLQSEIESDLDLIAEWTDEPKLSDRWKEHIALIEAE